MLWQVVLMGCDTQAAPSSPTQGLAQCDAIQKKMAIHKNCG